VRGIWSALVEVCTLWVLSSFSCLFQCNQQTHDIWNSTSMSCTCFFDYLVIFGDCKLLVVSETFYWLLFRMHCSNSQMRPICTDGVAWSACVSVCWSRSSAQRKRLNRSKCQKRVDSRNHVLDGGQDTPWEGQFLGMTAPSKKYWGSLLWCTQQMG